MHKYTTLPNLMQKLFLMKISSRLPKPLATMTLRGRLRCARWLIFSAGGTSRMEKFPSWCRCGEMYGLPTFHYSTVSKKAKEVPYEVMKRLFALVVSKCNRQTRRSLRFPKALRIVDSTTVTVGKTA